MKKRLIYTLFSFALAFFSYATLALAASGEVSDTKDASEGGMMDFIVGLKGAIPRVVGALFVIILAFLVAKIAQKATHKALLKTSGHESALTFLGKTAYTVCLTIGITISLSVLGIDISFIVGAATFGLGFALKDILENYVAGVIILLNEPFKIGDVVQVMEHFGRVEEIQARSTFVRIWDGQRVIVPNSFMISNSLTNFSTYPERRINIEVGVSYDTDLNKAMQIIFTAVTAHPEVLKEPAPVVLLTAFGDSSINIVTRFWIDSTVTNWLKVTSEGVHMIKEGFDREGINIPFPITTLSMNRQDSDDMYNFFEKRA